jgi:nucleoside-diphosphate-sugar epimerase
MSSLYLSRVQLARVKFIGVYKMRALVTGGAGFIGSHLVDGLLEAGHNVTVLDNLATGLRSNLDHCKDQIRFIEGDIRSLEIVREAVFEQDWVFHQAALGSVPRSIADPITSNAVNVEGTLNMLVASKDAGVKRFLYASSSSVYGDTPTLPKIETMPTHPQSPYALTKLAAEEYCRIFYKVYGLETVALRYFNVFGPRQRPDSQYAAVIPKFITAILADQAPVINGDGSHSRDFTYVSNNVSANLLAASAATENVAGKVFNIACNQQYSLLELVEIISQVLEKVVKPVFTTPRAGDVQHSRADIHYAAQNFKYFPKTKFQEGILQTILAYTG